MIRLANLLDIPFVQGVLNAASNLDKLAAYTDEQLALATHDTSQRLWIWDDGHTPAAFLWITGIGKAQRGPKIEEFGAVVPGRGAGTRLFLSALQALRDQRLDEGLWLAVAADNVQAIRFYERLGFQAIECRPAVRHRRAGPVADALLMALAPTKPVEAAGGVSIRRATLADRPAIDPFGVEVLHEAYDAMVGPTAAEALLGAWWGDALNEDIDAGRLWLAIETSQPVGLLQWSLVAKEPCIWKLYVRAGRRNQGLGRRLIEAMLPTLAPGSSTLLTEHLAGNQRAARFYEREGFRWVREEPADDPRCSTVWRRRVLG
jgi:ribosomal protein S18 acetylase RimI-like enzyme